MEWFKFYGGAYLSDPKMLMLTACERSCWLTLLSYASVAENGGIVKYLSEPQLMTAAGVSPMHEEWDMTVGVLAKFEGLGMVSLEKTGEIQVLNWAKRQESYLSNAERQKQYRERVKARSTGVITPLQQSNARIEENRIDITVANAPVVVSSSFEGEESPKAENRAKDKLAIYHIFSKTPQPWWIFAHEKKAALSLFDLKGVAQVRAGKEFMDEHADDEFCPQASSPSEYAKKLPALMRYKKKNGL